MEAKLSQAMVLSILALPKSQPTGSETQSSPVLLLSASTTAKGATESEQQPRGIGRGKFAPAINRSLNELKPLFPSFNRSDNSDNIRKSAAANVSEAPSAVKFDTMSTYVKPASATPDRSKNVICNTVSVTSGYAFEYAPRFEPDINMENSRFGFLNKHFHNIREKFLYNASLVFVPRRLQSSELERSFLSRTTKELVTMTLRFKQRINLESHPKLLHVLFEQAHKSLLKTCQVQDSQQKIVPNHVVAVRNTNSGLMLCIDHQHYIIQAKSVAEVMSELEKRYPKRFRKAVSELLAKVYVYHRQDDKIYNSVDVKWESRLLELETDDLQRIANPEDCNVAEIVRDVSSYVSETPVKFMSDLQELFSSTVLKHDWNLQFSSFMNAKARVLKPETIIFGDRIECTPENGSWEKDMKDNEFLMPTELRFWVIFYMKEDEARARMLSTRIQKCGDDAGLAVGKALFFEIASDSKKGYVDALDDIICKELQLIIVITPESANKPQALIKYMCCIRKPIPCQIVASSDAMDPLKVSEITMQLSVMLGGIPWTVNFPYENWMVCGINLRCAFDNDTLPVCSFVTALTSDATQWYSKAMFVEEDFTECLKVWLIDTLKKYKGTNGIYPSQLVIYQNCTEKIRARLANHYDRFNFGQFLEQLQVKNVEVCVILVQKDTNVSYYKDLKSGADNVPPGTVVDNAITNLNARDFFLTSHAPSCTRARPTHYEVIEDSRGFTSDQLQILTYKMCHLYYKQAKTVEMPAPCLYAEKLGDLVAQDICGIPSAVLDECLYYL